MTSMFPQVAVECPWPWGPGGKAVEKGYSNPGPPDPAAAIPFRQPPDNVAELLPVRNRVPSQSAVVNRAVRFSQIHPSDRIIGRRCLSHEIQVPNQAGGIQDL